MPTDEEELGVFAFGIRMLKRNEKLEWEIQSVNQGVPEEIVIMNMKALLQKMEKGFFDKFEK